MSKSERSPTAIAIANAYKEVWSELDYEATDYDLIADSKTPEELIENLWAACGMDERTAAQFIIGQLWIK